MSIEALWYASYRQGKPPLCKRLCRMPMQEQWDASIDLALAFAGGSAGFRQASISSTREQYWYWRHPASVTGWWLLTERITRRALSLYRDAIAQACREHAGGATPDQIAGVLASWKRTGAWRKRAVKIVPRRVEPEYWRRPGYLVPGRGQKRNGTRWRLPL